MTRAEPRRAFPGACDAHTHIFADPQVFPFSEPLSYAAPHAPYAAHRAMLDSLGLTRGVIVQPAPYGQNHDALLDALGQSHGRLKGVGILDGQASDAILETLAAGGVRGLRFVEMRLPNGERYKGSVSFSDLPAIAGRMCEHGLHAEAWANIQDFMAAFPDLDKAGTPIVLDHMGGFDPAQGVGNRDFQRLLGLLREGRVWVKLTLTRRSPSPAGYGALRRFHDALIEANARQLVWGSDWPFVRMNDPPQPADLLELFLDWVDDQALRQAILVDNPARLYRF